MDFRKRLSGGEPLLGTFVKIPTTHATEILGSLGFDFVIVDAEHAAFDRPAIDMIALAGRAARIATLVRVAEATAAEILSCLDLGADGILAPHVDSPEHAREVAAHCRYGNGVRGYSGNTRAGNWGGATMAAHMAGEDQRVVCVAMIEDGDAVDRVDEIARVPGIDALFIGRADLTSSLGETSSSAPRVVNAVERITAAAKEAGVPLMVLSGSPDDARAMRAKGATSIVVSSDQGFLRSAAADAIKKYGAKS